MEEKKFKEIYLPLMIKHFGLTKETAESLYKQVDCTTLTKKRVCISKKQTPFGLLQQSFGRGVHEEVLLKLKKYAGEDAVKKYMEEEGWKYDSIGTLKSIGAKTFIIYSADNKEQTFKYIKKTYPNRIDMWEFEKIDDNFSIAYD